MTTVLSYKDFAPARLEPSVAIKLQPFFVKALENIFFNIEYCIDQICRDGIVYDKKLDIDHLTELLFEILNRELKRSAEARFWFQLIGNKTNFKLNTNENIFLKKNLWQLQKTNTHRTETYSSLSNGIVHLGHAGVFINEQSRILIDPVFYNKNENNYIESINMRAIGHVDAIFFTHHHSDHFDLNTLTQLPKNVSIYVPKQFNNPLEPDMVYLLKSLNFKNVIEVSAGDRIKFNKCYIDILPFFGEGREIVGFEAFCPLYTSPSRRILFHADSGPNYKNKSILNSALLLKSIQKDGPIDTIFGSWWQGKDFLFRLSPATLISKKYSSKDWLAKTENCNCSIDYLCMLIKKTGARRFIAYAEKGSDIFNPEEAQNGYIATTSFYWRTYSEYVEKIFKATKADVTSAIPRMCF